MYFATLRVLLVFCRYKQFSGGRAVQTAPLVERARGMGAVDSMDQSDTDDEGTVPLPPIDGGDEDDMCVDLAGTYAVSNPQGERRAQTISSDDVRKLADSAVVSIAGTMDEDAMDRAALSNADQIQLPSMGDRGGTRASGSRARGGGGGGRAASKGATRDLIGAHSSLQLAQLLGM